MGMSKVAVEGLRISGLLHDVGKISVPAEILTNPTKLTDLEYGIVKQHSTTGHEILKTIRFPWPVAEATLQHHERLDGSGYPRALTGEKIIAEARILAVADVVDAMTNHRPYRPALGLVSAIEEIKKGSGVLFDADVVGACCRVIEKIDKRIMVVDDDVAVLNLLREFLDISGYKVLAFDSPKAALESFRENPYPIVLTDLNMPEMHGLEFIRNLRKLTSESEVMVLTGHGEKKEVVEAMRLGVSDFIDKPVEITVLHKVVEKAFQRSLKHTHLPLQEDDQDY
jgi:response regulator RpfG family c-di-GMP phosphodiesterase